MLPAARDPLPLLVFLGVGEGHAHPARKAATGLATQACTEWRKRDKNAAIDPVELSPKIISACERGGN